VLPAFRRGNVVGALQVGMRPREGGLDTRGTLQAAAAGKIECLLLVGADPLSDFPDSDLARRALFGARRIISVDTHLSASSERADVVLPAAAFGEKSGTTTNIEGRVTTLGRKVTPAGTSRPDWMIAVAIAQGLGVDLGYRNVDDITDAIAQVVASYEGVTREALASAPDGVMSRTPSSIDPINARAVEIGVRNSYDFRLVVSRKLYDAAVGTASSPSMAQLAPGEAAHLHPLDIERAGVVAGTEVKVISPRATVIMRIEADPTVLRGTVWVPFNQPGGSVGDLIDCTAPVTDVRIENL
jgi:NADH-quinone oxidoreductase subunit G